jgi:hypothetical protein
MSAVSPQDDSAAGAGFRAFAAIMVNKIARYDVHKELPGESHDPRPSAPSLRRRISRFHRLFCRI